ncbi:hypothetical protein D187_006678 [Cystobacter fuscus DSM 2262]|uniref:glucan endo-1,3-beta-D-glucosidase n=1 Tax=Cystobacter fuscus (strain ATCC 25194 / DSM 2262 / NBRC 100088 / M29) TaxID=1242864 RepID=S9NXG9_CYSF2|nr:DUF2403 domain-containing lipoprotein [Cystobacter fuscus]EPX56925.1 hypothetical protein D187_006678 [Cystobacter fuscus DSM 2262]
MKNPWMKRGPWLAPLALCVLLGSACGNTQTSQEPGSEQTGTDVPSEGGAGGGAGGDQPFQAADCAAGNAAALEDLGDDLPEGTGKPVTTMSILNVGGTGSYQRVTNMLPGVWGQPCPSNACQKADTPVSGPLAPFNEEMTVNFRGPMELYDIAVYQPAASAWNRVSSWNRCGSTNLTFFNNLGGGNVSGEWTVCGGNSQSYASADGKKAAVAPTRFNGSLANRTELNILSDKACVGTGDSSECGFYRGVTRHGWGGAKIFAIRARMPRYTEPKTQYYDDVPAIWMLNARVVRTAQYGCNCRGMGSPGGCGELDVAEVLHGDNPLYATSTIYSFEGATGSGPNYFQRPVKESATFIVIFDASGKIQMLRLKPDAFDFGDTVSNSTVSEWLARTGLKMSLP